MSYGENPGKVLTIQTDLTYDKDENFGHASAGKDLVLEMIRTGGNAGKAQIGTDGGQILGKFLSLDENKVASYMINATPMVLRKSAATIVPGRGLLCAANGQVKSAPATETAASASLERGIALEVLETAADGRILAYIP